MPPEEASEVPTVDDTASATAMVFGDDSNQSDDGFHSEPEAALEEGNPKADEKPEAPVVEEPVDGEAKEGEDKPAESEDEEPDKDASEDDAAKAEEEALRQKEDELLGIDAEPETDPVWKSRYEDSCSHITRLEGEINEKLAYLKSVGLEIAQTNDGLGLVPTEEYKQNVDLKDIDTAGIFGSLTETERDLFETDPAKASEIIAKKVAVEIASKRPAVTARAEDKILSRDEIDSVYEDFSKEKLPTDQRTLKFPDASEQSVVARMQKAYRANSPGMDRFRQIAGQDKSMNRLMLEHCYLKSFHVHYNAKAAIADAKAQLEKKKTENKKGPTVSAPGSSTPVKGQGPGNAQQTATERATALVLGGLEPEGEFF